MIHYEKTALTRLFYRKGEGPYSVTGLHSVDFTETGNVFPIEGAGEVDKRLPPGMLY